MKLPKIRENLLVQEAGDEVLVYDKQANKSYCLNETAKIVFNACDGKKVFADINLPQDIIYLSLDELKRNSLIEDNYVSPFVGMNRRAVIRKVGLASMVALPLIFGLTAPSAANAASGCANPGGRATGSNTNTQCGGSQDACIDLCNTVTRNQCCSNRATAAPGCSLTTPCYCVCA